MDVESNSFVQLPHKAVEELEIQSLGLLAALLANGPNATVEEVIKGQPDSPRAIKCAIRELEEKGYLIKIIKTGASEGFQQTNWKLALDPRGN